MDNNNFEQQFMQSVKASIPSVEQDVKQKDKPTIILVTAIILMIIQVILSIIILVKVSFSSGREEINWDRDFGIDENEGEIGIYNDNDYLIALGATCKSKKGITIMLTEDNTYQKLDANSTVLSSGTYAITRGSVFKFTDSDVDNSILFYDGYDLTDGTTFYSCTTTK